MTVAILLMVLVWFRCTRCVMSAGLGLGNSHSCGFWTSSEVKCWGRNDYGQLGDGTTNTTTIPVAVSSVSGVTAISAGELHTCAMLSGGTVKCWGLNNYGQLGDGTTTTRYTAVSVSTVSGVTAISAGYYHTCAMLSGGMVLCWGENGHGQLGDGTTIQRSTAGSVSSVSGVTAISAGGSLTCAILSGSTVKCWGHRVTSSSAYSHDLTAVSVSPLSGVTAISLGGSQACARLSGGTVQCWGSNDIGQLGDGTTTSQYAAVSVSLVSSVTAISAGGSHTCAMLSVGSVKCWGANGNGQLGDGTTTQRLTAMSVSSLSGVTAISAGSVHTCAMLSNSTVQCWGANGYGQLGDGTTTQRLTAVTVRNFDPSPTLQPTPRPSSQPSRQPSSQPSRQPSTQPTSQPSRQPSSQPSRQPTRQPTSQPSRQPTSQPTRQPSRQPTSQPSRLPTSQPTRQPSRQPTAQPTRQPTRQPTCQPTRQPTSPTAQPSRQPTTQPSAQPTCRPTSQPTAQPTVKPSSQPSRRPTTQPSAQPSRPPTSQPTAQPTVQPSPRRSSCPTTQPSSRPSSQPSSQPSAEPTMQPTLQPSVQPTIRPTCQPISAPTSSPTQQPSRQPSDQPSAGPTSLPTRQPSSQPSSQPTGQPSLYPSVHPTVSPSTQPTAAPSCQPVSPPSAQPSETPSVHPSAQPTVTPSTQPTATPSCQPLSPPSTHPTSQPTRQPSLQPSIQPSGQPSTQPTAQPSCQPSSQPTAQPTGQPSLQPTVPPSGQPSSKPTVQPSTQPTAQPSCLPSSQPSSQPTAPPSVRPSAQPSGQPSIEPTAQPSVQPLPLPSSQPTGQPSVHPSVPPSGQPSTQPTAQPSCQPLSSPSSWPSMQPTSQPTVQPTVHPSTLPSSQPLTQPTAKPSFQPSIQPTMQPTGRPTARPTAQPSSCPSAQPSCQPSSKPSTVPTSKPSLVPSNQPSSSPSQQPSGQPSLIPSSVPSSQPSSMPSHHPSGQPTERSSQLPTSQPSSLPSSRPSSMPSGQPSSIPSETPSTCPSAEPSSQPSSSPSLSPTRQPTGTPTGLPTTRPSTRPTQQPSSQPSTQPTSQPSMRPTALPTTPPTGPPSLSPSSQPTCRPSEEPSSQPSSPPSNQPTVQPTRQPSSAPTLRLVAVTAQPTVSLVPSMAPTARPSVGSAQAVNTATQGALQSFLTNGTTTSGTVTSVTADGLKLALAVVRPSNATHNGTTASYVVALPDSSTTVSLALPSSLSGGAVAVVVTTVEVDASRFAPFGSSGGNGSSNSSATVALPSPQLVSSVVSIQVSQLSSNGSLKTTTVPYFETSVSVVRSNSSSSGGGGGSSKPTVLAHNCTVGVVETVSVYCADTAVRLNLTCSGRAVATVRRQCPVSQAVCTVVDLTDNRIVSSTFCRTVVLGSSVVCQCGGSGSGVNGSEIASAGRVSVGVFQVYGAGSLTSSVALASALSASDVASRSAMIFASFGCLWGVGLLLMGVSWRRMTGERHRSKVVSSVQTEAVSSSWMRLLMPGYYQTSVQVDGSHGSWSTSWLRRRWVQVLVAGHPYLRVLRTLGPWWRGDGGDRTATPVVGSDRTGTLMNGSDRTGTAMDGSDRTAILADEGRTAMLDVVQALTALTLACGMLALLYDFQYPEDDGFCAAQTTQATCESRKMLLDPFQSQCLWQPPPGSEGSSGSSAIDEAAAVVRQIAGGRVVDTVPIASTAADEAPPCLFNGSNSSTLAFLLSYLITALFASVLALMLDRFQEVLKAKEATVTLRDRRRVGRVADEAIETGGVPAVKVDGKERLAVREQLAVREYPEAAVHRQRDQHRCSSKGKPTQQPIGRSRRRHAVTDVAVVDGDPMAARPVTRPSTVTMGRDPEAARTEGCHQTDVSATAQAVTQAKRSMSSADYAVTMLRLAVADEVGRLGGPAERHVCLLGLYRAFPAVVTLRRVWLWQCAVVGVLVVCNGGALYYIVSKAAVRGYGWQVSFLKIALFEWFSEVVLLRSVEIALFDYGLCWLVGDEVEAAVRRLEAVAEEVAAGPSTVAEDGGVAVEEDAASVSQEMARQWSGLPESRWVAGLRAGRSVSHGTVAAVESRIGGSDGRSDRRRRWWTRLLSRGSLETWEMAVSFGSPLVLAWLVFMYYRFVDGWLTSLSALGQGLAAMTVILSVVIGGVALSRCRYRLVEVTSAPIEKPLQVSLDGTEIAADGPMEEDDQSWVWSLSLSQSLMDGTATSSWRLSDNSSVHDNSALDTEDDDGGWEASKESKESKHVYTIDMDDGLDSDGDCDGGSLDWGTQAEDEDTDEHGCVGGGFSRNSSSGIMFDHDNGALDAADDGGWDASEESKESEHVFTIDMDGDQGDNSLDRDDDGSRDWETHGEDTDDHIGDIDGIGGGSGGFSDDVVDDHDVNSGVFSNEN